MGNTHRAIMDDGLRGDIKHQVTLNFLSKKQRGQMWIEDTSGISEGVMVRKTRQEYICWPPALANSKLAKAMAILNVQVR